MLDFGCHIISEVLEECNTLLEESLKRRLHWHVKDCGIKSTMPSVGMILLHAQGLKTRKQKKQRTFWTGYWGSCCMPGCVME